MPLVRGAAEETRAHYRTLAMRRRGPELVPEQVAAVSDERSPVGGSDTTVVYVHGGGWVMGSIETHDPLTRRVANALGARVVSVDYRLAPEHPFPAGLDDAEDVLRWQHGADPDRRIGVAGDSAGASLAAGLALRARDLPLAAQLLLYPRPDPEQRVEHRGLLPDPARDAVVLLDVPVDGSCGGARGGPGARRSAGVAPAVVATAEFDPLRDEGAAYAERLAGAGVVTEYVAGPGLIHGFAAFLGVVDAADATVAEALEIFGRALRG